MSEEDSSGETSTRQSRACVVREERSVAELLEEIREKYARTLKSCTHPCDLSRAHYLGEDGGFLSRPKWSFRDEPDIQASTPGAICCIILLVGVYICFLIAEIHEEENFERRIKNVSRLRGTTLETSAIEAGTDPVPRYIVEFINDCLSNAEDELLNHHSYVQWHDAYLRDHLDDSQIINLRLVIGGFKLRNATTSLRAERFLVRCLFRAEDIRLLGDHVNALYVFPIACRRRPSEFMSGLISFPADAGDNVTVSVMDVFNFEEIKCEGLREYFFQNGRLPKERTIRLLLPVFHEYLVRFAVRVFGPILEKHLQKHNVFYAAS